jgi:hypothetical protein
MAVHMCLALFGHISLVGRAAAPRAHVLLAEPRVLAAFEAADFEAAWPYTSADFRRIDESMDYEVGARVEARARTGASAQAYGSSP